MLYPLRAMEFVVFLQLFPPFRICMQEIYLSFFTSHKSNRWGSSGSGGGGGGGGGVVVVVVAATAVVIVAVVVVAVVVVAVGDQGRCGGSRILPLCYPLLNISVYNHKNQTNGKERQINKK
jgi:hypothetical protein